MKTKILLLSLVAFLTFSCKSDDESMLTAPPIPADQKYLSKVVNEAGEEQLRIEYNSDKSIKKIDIGKGTLIYRFNYDGEGNISESHYNLGSETGVIYYSHDENGILLSYTLNNVEYPIEYNNSVYKIPFDDGTIYEIKVTANEIVKINEFEGEGFEINFFYDANKSGPLINTKSLSLYTAIMNPSYFTFLQVRLNSFSMPLEEMLLTGMRYTFQNEYDEDGFLKKSSVTTYYQDEEPETSVLSYEYIQL